MLAAGCGGDDPVLDGPCSLTDPCDEGAVCDFTADGGPTCISASGDLDGDGLTNDKDFCNHQMGGQYDEDQDGFGDECDRCPIAPPRDTADSDTDMVDAPCDPAPTEDGDTILLFDGFQGSGLDARWMPTTASAWTQRPGEVIVSASAIGTQEFLKANVVGKNSIAVEASWRVDKLEAGDNHTVGIYADDPRPAGAAEVECYLSKSTIDQSERVVVQTNQGAMNQPATDAFATANIYRAGAYVTGTRAGCSILSNGNPLGTVQAQITPDQLSSVALSAQGTTARFQYILVVGR